MIVVFKILKGLTSVDLDDMFHQATEARAQKIEFSFLPLHYDLLLDDTSTP